MRSLCTLRGDDRSVSEVIGYVLMVGLVLGATTATVVIGAEALGGLQAENDAQSARVILEDVDTELRTVATSGDSTPRTFDFSGTAGGHLSVQKEGVINVSIVSGSANRERCSTETKLGTIRFEEDGRVVAYEAGGVWERSLGGGSAMITKPDIAFREGTLDVNLVNVSGYVNQGPTEASFNRTETRARNIRHEALSDCDSVDHVNITVESTFHEAWGAYLQEQTGGDLNTSASDQDVVRVQLDSGELPQRVDMANNTVVNLTESPDHADYMEYVNFGEDPRNVTVDKDAGNTYPASVTSLTNRPPQVGNLTELDVANVDNRTRRPVDVAFVMDESGSMQIGSAPGSCFEYRFEPQACPDDENGDGDTLDPGERGYEAERAAMTAVGTMNTTMIGDRASVLGYNLQPRQRYIDNSYFSSDASKINDTIDNLEANGGTNFADALNASIGALQYRGQQRDAHIMLLTDGAHDIPSDMCDNYGYSWRCGNEWDDRALNAANIADSKGYTIHTFSFGDRSDVNEGTLEDIADAAGGNYTHAADGDELQEAFASTIGGITTTEEYVTRTPLTTNMTSGGETHPPQIVGDTDAIASEDIGGQTFLNINDPTAPTLFSHTFSVDDDEPVVINATEFRCAEDGWRDTGRTTDVDGTTYPVARCTDIVATDESLDDDRIEFSLNGSDATPLMTNDDINGTLDTYTDSSHTFTNLSSNQVVINLNFTRDPTSDLENNLVMLYEIGLAEDEATGADVINFQESVVRLE